MLCFTHWTFHLQSHVFFHIIFFTIPFIFYGVPKGTWWRKKIGMGEGKKQRMFLRCVAKHVPLGAPYFSCVGKSVFIFQKRSHITHVISRVYLNWNEHDVSFFPFSTYPLLLSLGMEKINFSGGEPFLHQKGVFLGELVQYCKQELQLPSVSIVSNGSMIRETWFQKYGKL